MVATVSGAGAARRGGAQGRRGREGQESVRVEAAGQTGGRPTAGTPTYELLQGRQPGKGLRQRVDGVVREAEALEVLQLADDLGQHAAERVVREVERRQVGAELCEPRAEAGNLVVVQVQRDEGGEAGDCRSGGDGDWV